MPTATFDIDTLANVKAYMGIGSSDTTKDTILQTFITAISGFFEQYTNRSFAAQWFVGEILDGNGRAKLSPSHVPIISIGLSTDTTDAQKLAGLQARSSIDGAWADIETDLNHVFINSPQITDETANNTHNVELDRFNFPLGRKLVKLCYRAGYLVMPGDVLLTFYEMVQRSLAEAKVGDTQLGVSSVGDSRANITTSFKDLQPRWCVVLDRYKRRN